MKFGFSVSLIGYGRLAKHLVPAMVNSGVRIEEWYVRNKTRHEEITTQFGIRPLSTAGELNASADFMFLLVSDDAITEVTRDLNLSKTIVCHCSGMTAMENIKHDRRGIFYPLNTFNGLGKWNPQTPIFIQAEHTDDLAKLTKLASCISSSVHHPAPTDLRTIHTAAVISQNFSNYFITRAEELLQKNNLERRLIHPLLKSMIENLTLSPALQNQTGPAVRGDKITLTEQKTYLSKYPELLTLYELVTQAIQSHDFD